MVNTVATLRERVSGLDAEELIQNMPAPVSRIAPDGTILWANEAQIELLGYESGEYIGANLARFYWNPTEVPEFLGRLRSGERIREQETILVRRDGNPLHASIFVNPVFADGELTSAYCYFRDISSQKAAIPLQERLAAIVESSDDAIISKDLDGTIRSWNRGAQRIFGYTKDEVIGHHVSMLAAPEKVDEIPKILERIARGERVDHFQTRRKTKDGRILSISLTVSPVRDATGKIIGASKVARDVTEQVLSEQALRAANESLRRSNADLEHFAYSASHDLQEPLRMVASYADMLQLKYADKLGGGGKQYLGYIIEGATRMEQLLRDLRAFARVSMSTPEPTEDVDANAALDRALSALMKGIDETGATITRDTLPHVRTHDFHLQQLFQNLVGNAIRYRSAEAPRIHVAFHGSAGPGDEYCTFSVQDNGIGIDPEYKEQIFGIFKRLHSSAEYPGTGMGLAICQRIVERAGGRIWVESEPGSGSKFFFTLPRGSGQ